MGIGVMSNIVVIIIVVDKTVFIIVVVVKRLKRYSGRRPRSNIAGWELF